MRGLSQMRGTDERPDVRVTDEGPRCEGPCGPDVHA